MKVFYIILIINVYLYNTCCSLSHVVNKLTTVKAVYLGLLPVDLLYLSPH